MKDVAQEKLLAARDLLRHKAYGGEVHVDGGINRETAEFAGALGVDILVVGSALFIKGHDMGREIRLIRALADEGYQFTASTTACRRSRATGWSGSPRCRSTSRDRLMDEIEAGGVPVVMLRGEGGMNPDGVRDYDLLVPARSRRSSSSATRRRGSLERERRSLARGVRPRARGHPAAQLPVRALLQRTTARECPRRR